MRSITSFLLFFLVLSAFSQRVSFEDPDLTFSFKKPKGWEVFDDGYVVKVSPSAQDSASIYVAITYFESAKPLGGFPYGSSSNSFESSAPSKIRIEGESVNYSEKTEDKVTYASYSFMKYGQRFEIQTVAPANESIRDFKRIIRSIKITK